MTEEDKLIIATEIAFGTQCDLEHHDDEEHIAVDTIVIPMGYKDSDDVYIQKDELIIFICEECVKGLQSVEWTLLYCFNCNASQWIYLPLAKRNKKYYNDVNWMTFCPKCEENRR